MKICRAILPVLVIFYALPAPAESVYLPAQGRYAIFVPGASGNIQKGYTTAKSPALVLDRFLGIVWKCPNIQEQKTRWYKTDLANNTDKTSKFARYEIKVLDYPSSTGRIPAIVIDVLEGKVWNCPDIQDEGSPWSYTDLLQEEKEEKGVFDRNKE